MSEDTQDDRSSEPSPESPTNSGDFDTHDPATRDSELQQLRGALEQAEKRTLLAQAEAENFRKRMRRDVEEQLRFAAVPIIQDILGVRDNLLRALLAAENTADASGLREGVRMVAKQLDDALSKHAVQEIPALGETFDPNCHEAISQMSSEDFAAGLVAYVAQSGFRLHERIIRPSQVIVSTGPKTT